MNLCFLIGKVINEIDLKFVYNLKKNGLDKKHISIVEIELKLTDEQIIYLKAYNEIADYIYQHIKKNDFIAIEGKIRDNFIEIENLNKIEKCY